MQLYLKLGSTHGYQNCKTSQTLIFGGYFKERESLYTRVVIWVNTIIIHIDTRAILPKYTDPHNIETNMYLQIIIDSYWYQKV